MKIGCIVIFFIFLLSISCQKEKFYQGNDVTLQFSTDTISFDTIFTEIGSVSKRLMVYNPYDGAIKISSIKLAGQNTPYIININGVEDEAIDMTIEGGDSMYIFVQVLSPTSNNDLPVTIKDSIIFITNNKQQDVKLISYAQDVHLLVDSTIQTQTWQGDKPYLIYGDLVVDSLQTLTIFSGVNVYMHKNANIYVKGNIQALGSFYDPVVFKQDRLDPDYKDIPGYWGGIIIIPGFGQQKFEWAKIENGTSGIKLINWYDIDNTSITLSNTVIQNMSFNCLISYKSSVFANNCLIANAKDYTCYLDGGGTFQFTQTTIANYYSPYDNRTTNRPALYVSNYLIDTANLSQFLHYDITNSFFRNCIIYGDLANELNLDFKTAASDIIFDHCLIRKENTNDNSSKFSATIWNKDPKFVKPDYLKFELDTLSPAKDAGALEWGANSPYDLNNESRMNDKAPDLGAYERIEK